MKAYLVAKMTLNLRHALKNIRVEPRMALRSDVGSAKFDCIPPLHGVIGVHIRRALTARCSVAHKRELDAVIRPSVQLDRAVRDLVDESFRQAVDQIGEEEFHYIGKQIDRKILALRQSATKWIRELAVHCDALHRIYVDYSNGLQSLPPKQASAIGAALFYFVNPYDIVPDHDPNRGYLDDAHIINLCIKMLNKHDPMLFETYFNNSDLIT